MQTGSVTTLPAFQADNPLLVQQAQQRYGVGPHYASAYLDYWQRTRRRAYQSLEEILASPAPDPMWFDYAMSSRARGRDFVSFVRPLLTGSEKRYLDVGCGFGGCLAAFAELGMDVCGIEIDPERAAFSKATCRDVGLGDNVHHLSILADGAEEKLGRFDVITCLDVIEHVLDVPDALARMSRLLNPGGTLILEIPNKDSVNFVSSDGHFNLFGITLLNRPDSIEYHKCFFDFEYDVGYYFPLSFYHRQLRSLGMQPQTLISPMQPSYPMDQLHRLRERLGAEYARYRRDVSRSLPRRIDLKLRLLLARYRAALWLNRRLLQARVLSPETFQHRYLTNFWVVAARKQCA